MKNITKILVVCLLFVASANIVSAQKFGHLNSAELVTQLPAWKQAENDLATFQKQLENQMVNLQTDYETKLQALQTDIQNGIITKVEEQSRSEEIYALQQQMQQFSMKAQQDILQKEQSITQPIIDQIKTAIEQVAQENGFTYIFDTNTGVLLYSPPGDDVSALVKSKLGI